MQNPIFSADTIFVDQDNEGNITQYTGDRAATLSCGGKIIPLKGPVHLSELNTIEGKSLVLQPESIFSLEVDDEGNLQVFEPLNRYTPYEMSDLNWDSCFSLLTDEQLFYIRGLICANGTHLVHRHTSSSVLLKVDPVEATAIVNAIERHGKALAELGDKWPVIKTTIKPVQEGLYYRSRLLNIICQDFLTYKIQSPTFTYDSIPVKLALTFIKGCLDNSVKEDGTVEFRHRNVRVVRDMSTFLNTLGVHHTIKSSEFLPEISITNDPRTKGHTITLTASELLRARILGLYGEAVTEFIPVERTIDNIDDLKGLSERTSACVVTKGEDRMYPLTANTFAFSQLFKVREEFLDIASYKFFLDPSDPIENV